LKLDWKDVVLAVIIAGLGFLFTASFFIKFLDSMSPLIGVLFYYIIFFVLTIVLSKLDLIILTFKVNDWSKFIGMFLITMAFVIILSWGGYARYVEYANTPPEAQTGGNILFQSLDGIVWWGFAAIFPPVTPFKIGLVRFLTYVFTPFMLTLLGGLLNGKKQPEMSPIG
jgi:hypothetical protein